MKFLIAPVALCATAGMALALEPLTFGEFSVTPSVEIKLKAENGPKGFRQSAHGTVGLTSTWKHPIGEDLTLGVTLYASMKAVSTATERRVRFHDRPAFDPGIWLEGKRVGYLSYSHDSSASKAGCVKTPSAGGDYEAGAHLKVKICPSLGAHSVLYYRSPELAPGVKLAVSYTAETALERAKTGKPAESASIALLLDRTDASGVRWTGSLGVEKVLRVKGGGPTATSYQAGLSRSLDGLTLGGALAAIDNGDGSIDRAFGLGVSRKFGDALTVSLGAHHAQSRAAGARLNETSVSVIGAYAFVPEKVVLEGGLWQVAVDNAGKASSRSHVAIGLRYKF